MVTAHIARPPPQLYGEWHAACAVALGEIARKQGYRTAAAIVSATSGVPVQLVSAIDRVDRPEAAVVLVSPGRTQYSAVLDALALFDRQNYPRSYVQKQLHTIYVNSCLDIIYRGGWEQEQAVASAAARIASMCKKVAVAMPRRFGKTYSIAMFVAAMMYGLSRTGITIAIYSSGSRASIALAKTVRKFLELLPGAIDQLFVDNTECLAMRAGPGAPVRSLVSLPSSVRFRFIGPLLSLSLSLSAPLVARVSMAAAKWEISSGGNGRGEKKRSPHNSSTIASAEMDKRRRTMARRETRIPIEEYPTEEGEEEEEEDGGDEYDEDDDGTGCDPCGWLTGSAKRVTQTGAYVVTGAWQYTGGLAYMVARRRWDDSRARKLQSALHRKYVAAMAVMKDFQRLRDEHLETAKSLYASGDFVGAMHMYNCAKCAWAGAEGRSAFASGLASVETQLRVQMARIHEARGLADLNMAGVAAELAAVVAAAENSLAALGRGIDELHDIGEVTTVSAGPAGSLDVDALRKEFETKVLHTGGGRQATPVIVPTGIPVL